MDYTTALESTTFPQRLVLLGVTYRSVCDETPAHSSEVDDTCADHLDDVDGDILGQLSEGDVIRTLGELESNGLLEQVEVQNTSPVGKGRPTYALCVDVDEVLDTFEDDDRVASIVDSVRDVRA